MLNGYFFVTNDTGKISGLIDKKTAGELHDVYTFKRVSLEAVCPLCSQGEVRTKSFLVEKVKDFKDKFGKSN